MTPDKKNPEQLIKKMEDLTDSITLEADPTTDTETIATSKEYKDLKEALAGYVAQKNIWPAQLWSYPKRNDLNFSPKGHEIVARLYLKALAKHASEQDVGVKHDKVEEEMQIIFTKIKAEIMEEAAKANS